MGGVRGGAGGGVHGVPGGVALTVLLGALLVRGAADTAPEEAGRAAPFLVVVGEEQGRCVGALVSVRGALTSRECGLQARQVRAPGGVAVPVRAVRVARAEGVALLELEAPVMHGRPILLAEEAAQCESAAATCYLVRTQRTPHLMLSVLTARPVRCVAGDETCVQVEGPCEADAGAAVVCGGRLCGVLARSTPAGQCQDLHRFHSVPNWKRFLHCAHTLNTCSGDECSDICKEILPTQETSQTSETSETISRRGISESREERPQYQPVTEERPMQVATRRAAAGAVFEPNRADFRAGEYGDTADDYEEPEPHPAPTTTIPPPPTPAASTTTLRVLKTSYFRRAADLLPPPRDPLGLPPPREPLGLAPLPTSAAPRLKYTTSVLISPLSLTFILIQ